MKWRITTALLGVTLCAPAWAAGYDDLNAAIQLFNRYEAAAALPYFDRAIASGELTDGQKFIAHFDRGMTHLRLGDPEKALADMTARLALRRGDEMPLSARSNIYLVFRKYDLSLTDLDQWIAARPIRVAPRFARLALHTMLGHKAEAQRDLDEARKAMDDRNLSDDDAGHTLGMAHWYLERYAEAEGHFADALPARGAYGWLWLSLARAAQGKEISRSRLSMPQNNAWPTPVINVLLGQEKLEGAMAAAAKAEDAPQQQGQVCEANFYLGIILRFRGDAAAPDMLRKAAQICPIGFVEWLPAQIAAGRTP